MWSPSVLAPVKLHRANPPAIARGHPPVRVRRARALGEGRLCRLTLRYGITALPNLIAIDYDGPGQHVLFERASPYGSALPACLSCRVSHRRSQRKRGELLQAS